MMTEAEIKKKTWKGELEWSDGEQYVEEIEKGRESWKAEKM